MRRSIAFVLAVAFLPFVASAPSAEAVGVGACTISGTINFSPIAVDTSQGEWVISPAVIDCHGMYKGTERLIGPGRFSASGKFKAVPSGGNCLHKLGEGLADYILRTDDKDIHIVEPPSFVLVGAGPFVTPTLRGTFQIPPVYDNDCLKSPATQTIFLAEVAILR